MSESAGRPDDPFNLAERWQDVHTDESYGPQGKNLGILARAFLASRQRVIEVERELSRLTPSPAGPDALAEKRNTWTELTVRQAIIDWNRAHVEPGRPIPPLSIDRYEEGDLADFVLSRLRSRPAQGERDKATWEAACKAQRKWDMDIGDGLLPGSWKERLEHRPLAPFDAAMSQQEKRDG